MIILIGDVLVTNWRHINEIVEKFEHVCQKNCDTNLLTNIPEMSTKSQLERQQLTTVTKLLKRIQDLAFLVTDYLMLVTISDIDDEISIW